MPLFYNPSRDSRHRRACLALYRALIRQAGRIHLPDDLHLPPNSGFIHPLRYQIRSSFRRNRLDTSIRLVSSSLRKGYESLTLVHTAAKDANSGEYQRVIRFLRSRPRPKLATTRSRAISHADTTVAGNGARETAPPFLTRVPTASASSSASSSSSSSSTNINVDASYTYIPTIRPLPLSSLRTRDHDTGTRTPRRRIPVLAFARRIPFLRLSKPQSPKLSVFLKHKADKSAKRVDSLLKLKGEALQNAELEDEWEDIVARLGRREQGGRRQNGADDGGKVKREKRRAQNRTGHGADTACDGTFRSGVGEGIDYLNTKLKGEQDDMVARAKAMLDLVNEEKAMAAQERADRLAAKQRVRQGAWATKQDTGTTEVETTIESLRVLEDL